MEDNGWIKILLKHFFKRYWLVFVKSVPNTFIFVRYESVSNLWQKMKNTF